MRRVVALFALVALASAQPDAAAAPAATPASAALPPAPAGNNAARAADVPVTPAAAAVAAVKAATDADAARPPRAPGAAQGTSAVVALRTAADGSACRLPVVVRGSLVTNCTTIAGVPDACLVAGDPAPRPCAPPSGDELPLAAALASGSAGDGAPGALCSLAAAAAAPGVLPCGGGTTCEEVAGEPRLAASPYGHCALNKTAARTKMVVTAGAPPPAIAAVAAAAAARQAAPAAPGAANVSKVAALTVAARATVGGAACRLPLYYGGVLLTDCAPLGASGDAACFTKGALGAAPCAPPPAGGPRRTPLVDALARSPPGDRGFGALCALAASPNDTVADCMPGLLCAPMASGPLAGSRYGFCAGNGVAPGGRPAAAAAAAASTGPGASRMLVARARRTTGGALCRLPLYVNGTLLADCTAVAGATACFTGTALLKTGVCSATQTDWTAVPLADLLEAGTAGDGGKGALCALPGAKWPVGRPCDAPYACARAVAGPLAASTSVGVCGDAAGGGGGAAAASPAKNATIQRVAPAVSDADAKAGVANGTLLVARRRAVDGATCRLPVVLPSGRLAVDCRPLAGFATPACYTSGLAAAAPCAPPLRNATPTPLAALLAAGGGGDGGAGSLCSVFGGVYGGAMPATPCGAGLRCAPYAGAYGYCAPAAVPAPALSAGDAPPPPLPTLPATVEAIDVARRSTVTGLPCRLPLRVAGALVTDCASLQGGADRCFVDGNMTITHPCAPPLATAPPLPLVGMEADGRLSDGRRGAVCHLAPPPAAVALNGSAGVRAKSAPAIKCKAGLECVSFGAAPLAGSRFGWCKRVGAAPVGTDAGAVAAAAVPNPATAPPGGARAPGVAPTRPANMTFAGINAGAASTPDNRTVTARSPWWGAPVYDHAPNLGSTYYCGPTCVMGSLLALAGTVLALSFVCVLACRRGRAEASAAAAGGAPVGGGPPAGAFTAASPPPPAGGGSTVATGGGGGIALSLRPTRYERFNDEGGPPVLPPPPPQAAQAANPFAPAPAQPVQLSFTPLPK